MTAAELLLDLSERLTEADTKLQALAVENRFNREAMLRICGKAEGVRLALSYVTELQRMAGADL